MEMIWNVEFVILMAAIAWIDRKTMEIPDELNFLVIICGVASIWIAPKISMFSRIVGAFLVSVPMVFMIRLIPDSFGGGDVKLVFGAGLCLGWKGLLVGTFFAFLIGGFQAMYLLISGKAKVGEGAHMAFGPALCIGFLIAQFYGDALINWYLHLFY